MQLTIDPPDRGMKAGEGDDDPLCEARQIVTSLHVRPLVDDDLIELVVVERLERRRSDRDRRRGQTEHRRRMDVIRNHQPRRPAEGAQQEPGVEPGLAGFRKWARRALDSPERDESECRP